MQYFAFFKNLSPTVKRTKDSVRTQRRQKTVSELRSDKRQCPNSEVTKVTKDSVRSVRVAALVNMNFPLDLSAHATAAVH